MRHRLLAVIGFFTVLLLTTVVSTSSATVVQLLSEEDMVNQSQNILIGTCTSVKSEWNEDGSKIYTYATISVHDVLKGGEAPRQVTIKQPGGEVGDIGMLVEGASVFEEGEEALLFLKEGRQGFHRVLGLSQGKFSIKTDPVTQRKILVKKRLQRVRTRQGRIETRILEMRSERKLFLDELTERVHTILRKTGK